MKPVLEWAQIRDKKKSYKLPTEKAIATMNAAAGTAAGKVSSDLTFLTNEPGSSLLDRFRVLLGKDARGFDCLVGYFFSSGFYKLYPVLENVEQIRILVGLQTDRVAYNPMQEAKEKSALPLWSHAEAKEQVADDVLGELERSADSQDIETGVHKFVEWLRSGKLEIKSHPAENLHAKVYIMTFAEGDRDKGRVITGSSNLTQSGLQDKDMYVLPRPTTSDRNTPTLRRDIPALFFQATRAQLTHHSLSSREVILSSCLVEAK